MLSAGCSLLIIHLGMRGWHALVRPAACSLAGTTAPCAGPPLRRRCLLTCCLPPPCTQQGDLVSPRGSLDAGTSGFNSRRHTYDLESPLLEQPTAEAQEAEELRAAARAAEAELFNSGSGEAAGDVRDGDRRPSLNSPMYGEHRDSRSLWRLARRNLGACGGHGSKSGTLQAAPPPPLLLLLLLLLPLLATITVTTAATHRALQAAQTAQPCACCACCARCAGLSQREESGGPAYVVRSSEGAMQPSPSAQRMEQLGSGEQGAKNIADTFVEVTTRSTPAARGGLTTRLVAGPRLASWLLGCCAPLRCTCCLPRDMTCMQCLLRSADADRQRAGHWHGAAHAQRPAAHQLSARWVVAGLNKPRKSWLE